MSLNKDDPRFCDYFGCKIKQSTGIGKSEC